VAYVSHVLSGDKDFSLEQAEGASRFFQLLDDETEFLILLVEHARAGTYELKRYFSKAIGSRKAERQEIKKRIKIGGAISSIDQATYYSSWHYQAIHSLITIPEFRDSQAIAERLGIEPKTTHAIISFLLQKGLLKESARGYETTEKQIHLPRSSPLISKLHTNWRVRTLSALDRDRAEDYHYSGLVTLSASDIIRVREVLMRALEDSIEIVKPSKEEKLCLLSMDFFEL
jgi:uncharacterized protein (TIGR02147 family)